MPASNTRLLFELFPVALRNEGAADQQRTFVGRQTELTPGRVSCGPADVMCAATRRRPYPTERGTGCRVRPGASFLM
ncbi:hypothetical protein BX260_7595 [Streptomyces sp. 5112.2]|nr:hypothetical protein BX260_7595 [Streptomyces sp. 5112.2]